MIFANTNCCKILSTISYLTFSLKRKAIFDFDIINFLFLDGDVRRRTSYGVLIRFSRASFHISYFNCNKALTAELLIVIIHIVRRFRRLIFDTVVWWRYNVSLKTLLQEGISGVSCGLWLPGLFI